MMTEDCCAIFRPCSPDWLISGKSLTHRLTPPPPTRHQIRVYISYGATQRGTVHKTQRNTILSANLQPNWRAQFLRS